MDGGLGSSVLPGFAENCLLAIEVGGGGECWWHVEVKSSVTGVMKADGGLWLIESHGARGSSPTPRAPSEGGGRRRGRKKRLALGPAGGGGGPGKSAVAVSVQERGQKTDDGVEEK